MPQTTPPSEEDADDVVCEQVDVKPAPTLNTRNAPKGLRKRPKRDCVSRQAAPVVSPTFRPVVSSDVSTVSPSVGDSNLRHIQLLSPQRQFCFFVL